MGALVWSVRPDVPVLGIATTAVGLAVCLVGGLLVWRGRFARLSLHGRESPSTVVAIIDLLR